MTRKDWALWAAAIIVLLAAGFIIGRATAPRPYWPEPSETPNAAEQQFEQELFDLVGEPEYSEDGIEL